MKVLNWQYVKEVSSFWIVVFFGYIIIDFFTDSRLVFMIYLVFMFFVGFMGRWNYLQNRRKQSLKDLEATLQMPEGRFK